MKRKTECSECGAKFKVSSDSAEVVVYCPFCGNNPLPTDDSEDDDDDTGMREFDPDEEDDE